jgi:hypothetical protein
MEGDANDGINLVPEIRLSDSLIADTGHPWTA